MVDVVSSAVSALRLVHKIMKAVDQVEEFQKDCKLLGLKAGRLQPLLQLISRDSVDQQIFAPTLVELEATLNEAYDLIQEVSMDGKHTVFEKVQKGAKVMADIGGTATRFSRINENLMHLCVELNAYATIDIRDAVARLSMQHPTNGDGIEDLYKYDINDERSLLGKGKMCSVHRAQSVKDGQVYALKRIPLLNCSDRIPALENECAILSGLRHPHIVGCFAHFYSKKKDYFFIVMELIEGGTLKDKVGANPAPTEDQILDWANQMASALSYMHENGFYHRDLKPENVMLTISGQVKIIDLSYACNRPPTGTNEIGSMTYASYEKLIGSKYDGRDDVWAMGCILLELLISRSMASPGFGHISHPTEESHVECRNRVLSLAAKVSPLIGEKILPRLLQTPQANRCTSEELQAMLALAASARASAPASQNPSAKLRPSPTPDDPFAFELADLEQRVAAQIAELLGDSYNAEDCAEQLKVLERTQTALRVTRDPSCAVPMLMETGPYNCKKINRRLLPDSVQNVSAVQFVCPVCGEGAPSGMQKEGYPLISFKAWHHVASPVLEATISAIQQLPPNQDHEQRIRAIRQHGLLGRQPRNDTATATATADNPKPVVTRRHFDAVHRILLAINEGNPPQFSGLCPAICMAAKQSAWVCGACEVRYEAEGNECLLVKVQLD